MAEAGTRLVFAPVLTINACLVALHRAMRSEGKTAQETIAVASKVFDDLFAAMPDWLLRLSGRSLLRPTARRFFTRQAERSQARHHSKVFNPFRGRRHAEPACHQGQRLKNGFNARIVDLLHQVGINFQSICGQICQPLERGVARAKIIQHDPCPCLPKLLQALQRLLASNAAVA